MADKVKASDLFGVPITGGNALETAQLMIARENMMDVGDNVTASRVQTALEKHIKSKHATYSWGQLLQFQLDYFSNLVPFRFKGDNWLTTNVQKALRVACMYGMGGVKFENGKIIPLMINVLQKDRYGLPSRIQGMHADNVLGTQAVTDLSEPNWLNAFTEDMNDDIYIFQSNAYGWGMLIKGRPFLRQLEDILTMLCASSYVSFKRVIYNVADVRAYDNEIGLMYSPYSAVICNLTPDGIGGNRFKAFDVTDGGSTEGYFLYLDKLLETYYSLLGRRSNIDFKPERNVTNEVEANQEGFDMLQTEFKTQALELLDWVQSKTGKTYENLSEKRNDVDGMKDGEPERDERDDDQ